MGEQQIMVQTPGPLPPLRETWMEFLTPDLGSALDIVAIWRVKQQQMKISFFVSPYLSVIPSFE